MEVKVNEEFDSLQPEDKKHDVEVSRPGTADSKFDDIDLDDQDEEEPVIAEVHQATAPQAVTRARIVQVAKPIPPKLPPRNPFRTRSLQLNTSNENLTRSTSAQNSPVRGQSPPTTPSLKEDDSSASSLSSVEGLDRTTKELHSHQSQEPKKAEDDFNPLPESPIKAIPGSFT